MTRRAFAGRALAAGAGVGSLGSFLAACGGGDSSSDGPVTLQFWKFVAENDDPAIIAAVKQWNRENPDVQVKFQTFPPDQYVATKLTTAFAAKKGPDVFWISPGTFNTGIAAPVDDIVDRSAYSEASVQAVSHDGKMYALPFEQEPVGLYYYRKDLLEKAGVAPPKTWDGCGRGPDRRQAEGPRDRARPGPVPELHLVPVPVERRRRGRQRRLQRVGPAHAGGRVGLRPLGPDRQPRVRAEEGRDDHRRHRASRPRRMRDAGVRLLGDRPAPERLQGRRLRHRAAADPGPAVSR